MNIRHNTTISNRNITKKLAQFFIIPYSQLYMPWHNSSFSCCPLQHFQPTLIPDVVSK
ncbi:hypothetical protein A2U01_0067398, partial [Trifolium medium]|nr:hypothetical protein [Trifolium medium]